MKSFSYQAINAWALPSKCSTNFTNLKKIKRWSSSLNTFSIWLSYTKNNAPYTHRQKHSFDVVSLLNVCKNDVVENDQQRKKKQKSNETHAVMTHPNTMIQQYKCGKTLKFKRNNASTRVHLLNWIWLRYRVGLHDDWRSFGTFFSFGVFFKKLYSRLLKWKKNTLKKNCLKTNTTCISPNWKTVSKFSSDHAQ